MGICVYPGCPSGTATTMPNNALICKKINFKFKKFQNFNFKVSQIYALPAHFPSPRPAQRAYPSPHRSAQRALRCGGCRYFFPKIYENFKKIQRPCYASLLFVRRHRQHRLAHGVLLKRFDKKIFGNF